MTRMSVPLRLIVVLIALLLAWYSASRSPTGKTLTPTAALPSATPTATPLPTPDATEIARGFLTVTVDPPAGMAPLTVTIHASYLGPPVIPGDCGSAWNSGISSYEFGDGTQYLRPTPSCAVAPLTRVPTPTPPTQIQWMDMMTHRYTQAGTHEIRATCAGADGRTITATTMIVVR